MIIEGKYIEGKYIDDIYIFENGNINIYIKEGITEKELGVKKDSLTYIPLTYYKGYKINDKTILCISKEP